jgi:hypothetical protein
MSRGSLMADFVDDIFEMSPRIQNRLKQYNHDWVGRILLPLAYQASGSNDQAAVLAALRDDASKLQALESSVDDLSAELGPGSASGDTLASAVSGKIAGTPPPGTPPPGTPPPEQTTAPPSFMWVNPTISGVILIGFFIMLAILMTRNGADVEKLGGLQNVLFTLLGALAAAFTQVVNYWLGSSKGSADKTGLLQQNAAGH